MCAPRYRLALDQPKEILMPDHSPLHLFSAAASYPRRLCGRCRLTFPGDPDLFPGAIPDWWLCPTCRLILRGDKPGPSQRFP